MSSNLNELLTKAKDLLKEETTEIAYQTWFKSLDIDSMDGNNIVLVADSIFQKDLLESKFQDLVVNTFNYLTNMNCSVSIILKEEQTSVDSELLKERFWDMFIVDAFIGNWDRHNGNWGFLYDTNTDEVTLAPVYDCGSSLYPQADEEMMREILNNKNELNHRVFDIPLSAITYNGKKINYFKFLSSGEFEDCNKALIKITERIDMEKVFEIIDNTETITEIQNTFYKTMLSERKKRILDFSVNKIQERTES